MKIILLIIFIGAFFLTSALAQARRPKQPKKPMPASEKIIYEPDAELLKTIGEKVRVVKSKQDWAEFRRQAPVSNPAKTRAAYIARFKMENNPEILLDVIVVHDAGSDKFYEIRGIDNFSGRPFSDFRWISTDVLQFDQWVNPNNGGRYQVNLKTGKIVAAGYVRSN